MIDWSKPVQTRDGREVVIYTTTAENKELPIVGVILDWNGCPSDVEQWYPTGAGFNGVETPQDLVNVPETVFANIYFNKDFSAVVDVCLHDSDGGATKDWVGGTAKGYRAVPLDPKYKVD